MCLKDKHLPIPALSSPLRIGTIEIRNRVALAPMSGVTDLPFRRLAWRFGAGFVVTEMVASRELVCNASESWARLKNSGIKPHIVQLAGREAHWMAEAARIAADSRLLPVRGVAAMMMTRFGSATTLVPMPPGW